MKQTLSSVVAEQANLSHTKPRHATSDNLASHRSFGIMEIWNWVKKLRALGYELKPHSSMADFSPCLFRRDASTYGRVRNDNVVGNN